MALTPETSTADTREGLRRGRLGVIGTAIVGLTAPLLVNVTPIGMAGAAEETQQAFDDDVAAFDLERGARDLADARDLDALRIDDRPAAVDAAIPADDDRRGGRSRRRPPPGGPPSPGRPARAAA